MGFEFLFVEVTGEAALQFVVHRVRDSVDVPAGCVEAFGREVDAGEMQIHAFAFDFIVGDGEGIGPGTERIVGPERTSRGGGKNEIVFSGKKIGSSGQRSVPTRFL